MSLSFADFGLRWFDDIIGRIIVWLTQTLTDGYDALSAGTLSTPTPAGSGVGRVFSKPLRRTHRGTASMKRRSPAR